MKEEWKHFIDKLPLKKTELHKDDFLRTYQSENIAIACYFDKRRKTVQILLSAAELNQYKTLKELIVSIKHKLK